MAAGGQHQRTDDNTDEPTWPIPMRRSVAKEIHVEVSWMNLFAMD
jgi:hypothetical protein